MFIIEKKQEQLDYYLNMLKKISALSNLFSESATPNISSRFTENLYCRAFNARNHSRSDISADASIDKIGVGIKTFVEKSYSQKIAEFNKLSPELANLSKESVIEKVIKWRNERLDSTKAICDIDKLIYHCITRSKGTVNIYETEMNNIDADSLEVLKLNDNSLKFKDKFNSYSYNLSKNTLYKKFETPFDVLRIDNIKIIEDPFDFIEKMMSDDEINLLAKDLDSIEYVYLPLYSSKKPGFVPTNSGLNLWNANGRKRSLEEVYIPVPISVHKKFPTFFPSQNENFKLKLPTGEIFDASVCQANRKALMTKVNDNLGPWILRKVLRLKSGEVLTYDKLEELGIDSVIITKRDNIYSIDFTKLGSYEKFKSDILSI